MNKQTNEDLMPLHRQDNILDDITIEELVDTVYSNEKVKDEATVKKVYKELVAAKLEDANEVLKEAMPMILKELKSNESVVIKEGISDASTEEDKIKFLSELEIEPSEYKGFENYFETLLTAMHYDIVDADDTEENFRVIMTDAAKKYYEENKDKKANESITGKVNWTTVGNKYWLGEDGKTEDKIKKEAILKAMGSITWKPLKAGDSLPMGQGMALEAMVKQLNTPNPTEWGYAHMPGSDGVAIIAMTCKYKNALVRVYVADEGSELVPIATEVVEEFKKNESKAYKLTEAQYKSDDAIADEFKDMKIVKIEVKPSGFSGFIELEFPNAGEHVGGGTDSVSDSWIKYDSGKIAFDNWYPENIYLQLVKAINDKLGSNESNDKSSGLTGKVYPPECAANPSQKWSAEIRKDGWAWEEKFFDSEKEAEDYVKNFTGDMSKGVATQYADVIKRHSNESMNEEETVKRQRDMRSNEIKAILKKEFPKNNFRVKIDKYSMGESININTDLIESAPKDEYKVINNYAKEYSAEEQLQAEREARARRDRNQQVTKKIETLLQDYWRVDKDAQGEILAGGNTFIGVSSLENPNTFNESGEEGEATDINEKFEVAKTILEQLGGQNRLVSMLGAYNFGAEDNSVSFRFKAKGKNGINYIKITLNSMDTYDIKYSSIRGTEFKTVAEDKGIYNDQLREVIEQEIGLYLSMGTMGREKNEGLRPTGQLKAPEVVSYAKQVGCPFDGFYAETKDDGVLVTILKYGTTECFLPRGVMTDAFNCIKIPTSIRDKSQFMVTRKGVKNESTVPYDRLTGVISKINVIDNKDGSIETWYEDENDNRAFVTTKKPKTNESVNESSVVFDYNGTKVGWDKEVGYFWGETSIGKPIATTDLRKKAIISKLRAKDQHTDESSKQVDWSCECGRKDTTSSVYDEKICPKCQKQMKRGEVKESVDESTQNKTIRLYADGKYLSTTGQYPTVKAAIASLEGKDTLDVAGRQLTGKENPADIKGKKITGEIIKESVNEGKGDDAVLCPTCGKEVWDVATVDQRLNKCHECGIKFNSPELEEAIDEEGYDENNAEAEYTKGESFVLRNDGLDVWLREYRKALKQGNKDYAYGIYKGVKYQAPGSMGQFGQFPWNKTRNKSTSDFGGVGLHEALFVAPNEYVTLDAVESLTALNTVFPQANENFVGASDEQAIYVLGEANQDYLSEEGKALFAKVAGKLKEAQAEAVEEGKVPDFQDDDDDTYIKKLIEHIR